ncbi:MAG: aspartate kinase [Oscillospiraceae bacterium]|nr:aspartate kinase [Oscillospiraceae bacterium]
MNLIVQKFGGSSVADAGRLLRVSQIVREEREAGHDVLVVVSAQGDATDELLQKARGTSKTPPSRELDALLSAGEQVSAALTAMTLEAQGIPAVSLSAWQLPIRTDTVHGDASIRDVGVRRVRSELLRHRVVVVTGFQGVDELGDVTTLGRGGSDYTAVALAAAFGAKHCHIYTDVDGVYTADPRLCPTARRLERVSYEDMYALSRAGAQVLHDKCVALAQEKGVEPEVRSTVPKSAGTRICGEAAERIAGVTCRARRGDELSAVTVVGRALPSLAVEKRAILSLNAAGIVVRGVDAGTGTLTLYVARERDREALCAVHDAVLAE